jgi:acylpyruvate hydrolase
MRFAAYCRNDRRGLAVDLGAGFRGLFQDEAGYPGDLQQLIGSPADLRLAAGALARGTAIDPEAVQFLPPLPNPRKIICIGLPAEDSFTTAAPTPPEKLREGLGASLRVTAGQPLSVCGIKFHVNF